MPRQPIDRQLLKRVLAPYRAVARYVRLLEWVPPDSATVPTARDPETWIALTAECAVTSSWYATSSGHLNAVELNITWNQVLYSALAACASAGIRGVIPWNADEFFQHQVSDMLLVDYRARFSRPIDGRGFTCHLELRSVRRHGVAGTVWIKTSGCAVSAGGGCAAVDATVALATGHAEARPSGASDSSLRCE